MCKNSNHIIQGAVVQVSNVAHGPFVLFYLVAPADVVQTLKIRNNK